MGIILKSVDQIEGIRESSRLAARSLEMISAHVSEGVDTARLNDLIHEFILDHNATPATLNYKGYPASCCISLNDVVCHGIPSSKTILADGDILNIDVTTILDGFFGDTSRMYTVGEASENAKNLMAVTKQCLDLGIEQCRPNNRIGDIGAAIYRHASKHGYGVVYEFCGHGVGLRFHEDPEVSHDAKAGTGPKMRPGMTFTIEPMINEGKSRVKVDKEDGWTARTIDGKLSAQYEHTILITPEGHEVLTDVNNEY